MKERRGQERIGRQGKVRKKEGERGRRGNKDMHIRKGDKSRDDGRKQGEETRKRRKR